MNHGHDPRAIANKLLEISKLKNIDVSMMKLIKLVFFAHGWMLGITGKPLSHEAAEAWQYGPVFRSLYQSLPYQGASLVTAPIRNIFGGQPFHAEFSNDEVNLMNRIVDVYGSLGAFALSDITHEAGSPWHLTIQNKGKFAQISDDDIRKYFSAKVKPAIGVVTHG